MVGCILQCVDVFYSVCIYGGGDRGGQIKTVKKGVDIVIGVVLAVVYTI